MTLIVEITSDFICPWCLVADARLNQAIVIFTRNAMVQSTRLTAIAQLNSQVEVQRIWYPFELNPDLPKAGIDRKTYRTKKFGSWEYSQILDTKTIEATQADGINFRYDLMQVTPNTFNAHRLTWFASKNDKATKMAERILKAYFTEGQNIGDIETLANLAAEIDIDANTAKTFLLSDAGIEEVRELERQAKARDVRSVPTIRIGQEILVGAQSIDDYLVALQNAVNELEAAY
ncbi:MAG: DsbA family oxidoreductase [Pelatocladus maniniholoensis HA4357-MV3]|jgi:predicted DsbA family dithiol-disulfide isomerase|uniref:DsbA family oxidoreductase n=1 Tax=Pelatocladus maniniholoensis HA4357-MV3 TaxID=1117104 RepID=A0A9E3H7J3_9NOST|nr:DsbA family oxidoreductase [Pelatocladus maniniholoensis HA4357-MV3]